MAWTRQIHDWLGDGGFADIFGLPDSSSSLRHAKEYVWTPGVPSTGTDAFDPASLGENNTGGVLSNNNTTMNDGMAAGTLAVYGTTGFVRADPNAGSGFVAEFHIDVFHVNQIIGLFGTYGLFPGTPVGGYSNGIIFPSFGSATPFTTGDVVGMVVWGDGLRASHAFPRIGFWLNGVFQGTTNANDYAPSPFRFGVETEHGQISVETNLSAMVYGATYAAYTNVDNFDGPTLPSGSWPAP